VLAQILQQAALPCPDPGSRPGLCGTRTRIDTIETIDHIQVLPVLFERIFLPSVVWDELTRPQTPELVRSWIAQAPAWLDIRSAVPSNDPSLADLDAGEKAAILLATEVHADLLLMDERRGVRAARSKGFRVAGPQPDQLPPPSRDNRQFLADHDEEA
jgi:predicted nucleic acid-binding protein